MPLYLFVRDNQPPPPEKYGEEFLNDDVAIEVAKQIERELSRRASAPSIRVSLFRISAFRWRLAEYAARNRLKQRQQD